MPLDIGITLSQQIFAECLLWASYYSIQWRCNSGQEREKKNPCLHEAYIIAVQKVNLKISKYKFRQ